MSVTYVHTLGDSTLDNLYWELPEEFILDPKTHDISIKIDDVDTWKLEEFSRYMEDVKRYTVEGRLQIKLNASSTKHKYEVVSHAYDGFTTRSVLQGDEVGMVLPPHKAKDAYLREKDPQKGLETVYPLKDFKKAVEAKSGAIHYVILSVGGNDFRDIILALLGIIRGVSKVQKRYLEIVKEIISLKDEDVRPILMLQYRPEANYFIYPLLNKAAKLANFVKKFLWDTKFITPEIATLVSSGQDAGIPFLGTLMERFYKPILEYAKEKKIPILDITNTFNPYHDKNISDRKNQLYVCSIEPGPKGGGLIAEGIDHIVKNHDYLKSSRIYSKQPDGTEYSSIDNLPDEWRVSYVSSES